MPTPNLILAPPAALDDALAEAVAAAKQPDPLAPVTILVGNTLLRPYLRRRLAELNGGHINLHIQTFAELGMALGERAMWVDGRGLLPPLASRVLAQQVARGAEGYFQPVADAPGFALALRRLIGELREAGVDPAGLAAAAGATDNAAKITDTAALYERHESRRAKFYDATDCLTDADATGFDSVALFLYGVWDTSAAQRALLGKLIDKAPTTALIPHTGTDGDAATADLRAWLTDRGATPTTIDPPPPATPTALTHLQRNLFREDGAAPEDGTALLVSAPDPPREVVEAARACLRWAREGIAFHEMAITYRHTQRYRPLVQSVFASVGIPVYVHDGTPLTERPLGRRAVALLDLIDEGLPRAGVMEFLTDAELPSKTRDAHPGFDSAAWDSITRRAGVVEGLEQWTSRPQAYLEETTRRNAEHGREAPNWGEKVEPLTQFVTELASDLDERPDRATWETHVNYIAKLYGKYIRDVEPIVRELRKLADLDAVSDAVEFEHFRNVARQSIEDMRDPEEEEAAYRDGKQPPAFARRGVNVLDVNSMRHLRFRAVAVLGLAERSFPPPARQDALLLDSERQALNAAHDWQLPLRAAGADPEPLQFTLAVHAAQERIQLSFARTETGEVSPRLPSHFFRAAATALAGERVGVEDLEPVPAALRRRTAGNRFAAPTLNEALDANEYDRTLISDADPAIRALGIELVQRLQPAVTRAIAARNARWRDRSLTVYDGVFTERAAEALEKREAEARPMSATTLEGYAECPYSYFLQRVMWLDSQPEPERIRRIEPVDRGSLTHSVLENFLGECFAAGERPDPDLRDKHLDRLRALAEQECERYEQHGLTGLPALWALDRQAILDDLTLWYDNECKDEQSFADGSFEQAFGFDEPFEITAEGVKLRFRGYIDRLEWTGTGDDGNFRVIDYKTGSLLNKHKPGQLVHGTALQLPIYMLAAAEQLGIDPERGEAQYFFVTTKGGFQRVAFTGEDLKARDADFRRLLASLAGGIAGGDFHPVPGKGKNNCRYCDFDTICDAQRELLAERKADDPRAAEFAALEEID